jgi:hypothetical protein
MTRSTRTRNGTRTDAHRKPIPLPGRTHPRDRVFLRRRSTLLERYICYTICYDSSSTPKRAHGFGRIRSEGSGSKKRGLSGNNPTILDERSDAPEQFRAIRWVGDRLYSVIFEVRADAGGEYLHLVTLWRATREEQKLYDESS